MEPLIFKLKTITCLNIASVRSDAALRYAEQRAKGAKDQNKCQQKDRADTKLHLSQKKRVKRYNPHRKI